MDTQSALSFLKTDEGIRFFREFMDELNLQPARHLLRNDIVLKCNQFLDKRPADPGEDGENSSLQDFISKTQEMLLTEKFAVLLHRIRAGHYMFYRIPNEQGPVETLMPQEYLDLREEISHQAREIPEKKLLIDFQPFYSLGPEVPDSKKIGSGMRYLNNYIAAQFQEKPEDWQQHLFDFLVNHRVDNRQALIDGGILAGPKEMTEAIRQALAVLEPLEDDASILDARSTLQGLGIGDGFGNTAGRAMTTLQLLLNLFESASADYLEELMGALPLVSKVAVISPHGWFGQDYALDRPETGGQVVYILDQVKALETYLKDMLASAGLSLSPKILVVTRLIPENEGTTSDQRLEKINGSDNCWILRVPFKDPHHQIVPQWISRFHVWPYLEQFALDTKNELLTEFGGKPDMIVGNFSDGNLAASLLSTWLQVVQCNISHSLEKPKYLFSALYWKDMEKEYNYSLQFTADLISMNQADIIVSSTAEEIAGTETTLGQYESYSLFSMPDLYKVIGGVNLFHPKFNVISPGVDQSIYFSHSETGRRVPQQTEELTRRLFSHKGDDTFGELKYPEKVPIFSIARLDKIKNLTGLVESFGRSPELQEHANLVLITSTIREEGVTDEEELSELKKMYHLIAEYGLQDKMRWVENSSRQDGGESYRIIADRRGVFVQPALFEAFGLTVLEAMATGLPVFATQFGGPQEIIDHGKNGFLINPTQPELLSQPILEFLLRCGKTPSSWEALGGQAVVRVRERYTWSGYSEKLIKAAKLYGFWNFSQLGNEKKEIDLYCNMLFHMIFKNRLGTLD